MRPNGLHRVWESGGVAFNAWLALGSSYGAEVLANLAFDSITVDLQHGMVDFEAALGQFQAISTTNAVPMARVACNEPWMVQRVLDAGAYGVICPMISTPEECRKFVTACRYPPLGERSFGPARGLLFGGRDYLEHANSHVLAWAMIETAQGVAHAAEIVATEGLDGIYIGPSDLALSLGFPLLPQIHEGVRGVIRDLLKTAKSFGKRVGIFCPTVAVGREMAALGADLVTVSNDTEMLRGAAASILDTLRLPAAAG